MIFVLNAIAERPCNLFVWYVPPLMLRSCFAWVGSRTTFPRILWTGQTIRSLSMKICSKWSILSWCNVNYAMVLCIYPSITVLE